MAATLLIVVGGLWLSQRLQPSAAPETNTDTTTQQPDQADDTPSDLPGDTPTSDDLPADPMVDRGDMSSIEVEPLQIIVYYSKGTPGFEFAIKRTDQGTQYAQFASPELVGTKCTDDVGVFATILENPTATEDEATVSRTTVVGDTTYGLSLPGDSCTSDPSLLKQYQSAFSDGFSLLEEL